MSGRVGALVAGIAVVLIVSTAVGLVQLRDHRESYGRSPTVPVARDAADDEEPAGLTGPAIVFRHTGIDAEYGRLAAVPLEDPSGPRVFMDQECDRVDATAGSLSCLVIEPGVPTRFAVLLLDAAAEVTSRTPLPGIPSRTRFSPSGRFVATTVFVSGDSYMQSSFSTRTAIRRTDGTEEVDLEDLDLVMNGRVRSPADRNYWGVTFRDDRVFWATVATGGQTYLIEGDLETGRMTTLTENAECPSLSPDATRIAYKVRVGDDATPVWELEVRDLTTDETVRLPATRGLDDQVEWLDDDTLLYGLPRDGEAGVTDAWAVEVNPRAAPDLLIKQAWSPAVLD